MYSNTYAAVARGMRQYVLIGAGFDSYAMRTPAAPRLALNPVNCERRRP